MRIDSSPERCWKQTQVSIRWPSEIAIMQSEGRPIDATAVDDAIGEAFEDVAKNYRDYPPGYFEPMLEGFFGQTEAPYGDAIESALFERFEAAGWPRRPS